MGRQGRKRPCRFFFYHPHIGYLDLMSYRRKLPWLILLSTGCSHLPHQDSTPQNLAGLASTPDLAAISCTYERDGSDHGHRANWYFMREADRTESRDGNTGQSEIWERDDQGRLSKTQVFRAEKVVLDYSNGDLLASNRLPTWASVSSVIDPAELGHGLTLNSRSTLAGLPVETYKGVVNGIDKEIDWIPSKKLPARLKQTSSRGTEYLTLKECTPLSNAAVKPTSVAELNAYRHIDFSDLGDMESDPVVQRVNVLLGGPPHSHGEHR